MTPQEAIKSLKMLKSFHNGSYGTDIDIAIKALEQINCLTGRPCEVCEFHSDNGCRRWKCVFEEGTK